MSFQLQGNILTETASVSTDYNLQELAALKVRRQALIAEQQAEIDAIDALIAAAVNLGYVAP